MSEESRTYQARITGFTPRTEWNFKGTDFDGFKSQQCLLLEAKARYDQFFTEDNKPKFFFTIAGLPKMMQQATTQSLLITSSPPSRLHWHFMQPRSHAYLRSAFRRRGFFITTFHTP
ncbi:restriction endonuclease fold toxin 5 of polymorphic toxin system [Pseudoduganella lurida]|uniref:Restriction endonuclease fold toxin 5 of polymorphic toxin system n=2 Tax=Pseudoduganella lurida TaxID=1036180 RepID=A0A562R2D2_9BURK|nr:restriction endonuclease fold toxin 5 of polymorphic toxin system [Pseudoduganella lurida]